MQYNNICTIDTKEGSKLAFSDFWKDCKVESNDGSYIVRCDVGVYIEVESYAILSTQGIAKLTENQKEKVFDLVDEFISNNKECTEEEIYANRDELIESANTYGI